MVNPDKTTCYWSVTSALLLGVAIGVHVVADVDAGHEWASTIGYLCMISSPIITIYLAFRNDRRAKNAGET